MEDHAWSFSALNDFLNCNLQYYLTKVAKSCKVKETEEMKYGKISHKQLELRVSDKTPLPDHLMWLEPMISKLEASGAELTPEKQIALNKGFGQVSWFDKKTWLRIIVDLAARYETESLLLDYKTGKRKQDTDQLMLFAGAEFAMYPKVEKVKAGYIWMKEKKLDSEVYTRDDIPQIWNHFLPKVERLNKAFEDDLWPARPSGLCPWCPATLKECKHAKK